MQANQGQSLALAVTGQVSRPLHSPSAQMRASQLPAPPSGHEQQTVMQSASLVQLSPKPWVPLMSGESEQPASPWLTVN
jgi:hypothetical protein